MGILFAIASSCVFMYFRSQEWSEGIGIAKKISIHSDERKIKIILYAKEPFLALKAKPRIVTTFSYPFTQNRSRFPPRPYSGGESWKGEISWLFPAGVFFAAAFWTFTIVLKRIQDHHRIEAEQATAGDP